MDEQNDKSQYMKTPRKSQEPRARFTLQHFQVEKEILERLIFCEYLEICQESALDPKLGQFSIHVELKGGGFTRQPQHFQVHASGTAVLGHGGTNTVTLTSNFTMDLLLIEETWSEIRQIKTEGQLDSYETQLYLGRGKQCYYTSTRNYKNGILTDEQKSEIKLRHAKYLVSEGINIVLLRMMALKSFVGEVKCKRILRNGQPTYCVYEAVEEPNGEETDVIVCQTVRDKNYFLQTFKTVLTIAGRLVKYEWAGSAYCMKMIPDCPLEKHGICRQYPIVPLERVWQTDIQLVSKHQDHKAKQVASFKSYMDDNPDVKHLLADFIQALFLLKPADNIIDFAIGHFNTCTHRPEDELLWEEENMQGEGSPDSSHTSIHDDNSEESIEPLGKDQDNKPLTDKHRRKRSSVLIPFTSLTDQTEHKQ